MKIERHATFLQYVKHQWQMSRQQLLRSENICLTVGSKEQAVREAATVRSRPPLTF